METVIVERVYEEPFTDEQAMALKQRVGPCFEMRDVERQATFMSKDRLRAICIYRAPDAATVRDAHDQEGVPYAKIWTAFDLGEVIDR